MSRERLGVQVHSCSTHPHSIMHKLVSTYSKGESTCACTVFITGNNQEKHLQLLMVDHEGQRSPFWFGLLVGGNITSHEQSLLLIQPAHLTTTSIFYVDAHLHICILYSRMHCSFLGLNNTADPNRHRCRFHCSFQLALYIKEINKQPLPAVIISHSLCAPSMKAGSLLFLCSR